MSFRTKCVEKSGVVHQEIPETIPMIRVYVSVQYIVVSTHTVHEKDTTFVVRKGKSLTCTSYCSSDSAVLFQDAT